jgi:hypothetical protein
MAKISGEFAALILPKPLGNPATNELLDIGRIAPQHA